MLRVYLPKAVLSELETSQTVAHMGMTLLVISVALLLLLLVQTRLDVSISRYGYLLLQEMRGEYAKRLLNANYEEMETQDFRSARDQAKQAIYGERMDGKNITPVNDFMKNLLSALTNIGSVLLYTVMIARVSPILIPVLLLPPMLIFYLDGKVGVREKKNWDAVADAAQKEAYTRERAGDFTYAKDIRLYNMKPWLLGMYQKYAGIRLGLKKEELLFTGGLAVINNVINYLQIACICGFFLYQAWIGRITISDVVLYFGAAASLTTALLTASQTMVDLRLMGINYQKYADFVDMPESKFDEGETLPSKDEMPGAGHPDSETVTLELQSVSYRFPDADTDLLHNLNLTVKSGERIAVVGLNGAGKTTLMKLLCGLLTPTGGRILLNGVDMSTLPPEKRYEWFSCAFQDIGFLPVSVQENICGGGNATSLRSEAGRLVHESSFHEGRGYGKADRFKLFDCLEKAGIIDKILSLPDSVNTLMEKDINEDAVDFSGGEKQKLALARALYQDRPVLILDEPTAALDPLAEYEMYQRYADFAKDKLSFFVSHRLSSTRFCTRILLLQDGCFAEQGTHEELLKKNGVYAELFRLQSYYYNREKEGTV
ncbi:MAG: ABC transporter ATP-binding protein/permease [Clostridiales bacterium]|nr:ABC transporter ATP-binding protein/permease [Clostridiales bacterium]